MRPTLTLRCDAGQWHGLGHLSRCLSIAESAREFVTDVVVLTDFGGGQRPAMALRSGVSPAAGPIGSDADLSALLGMSSVGAQEHHVLVLDSREIPEPYLESLRARFFLVCLDDEQARQFACNVIINPNPWADNSWYSYLERTRVLAGARYNLVRDAFFKARRVRDRMSDRPTVMVTMGGEDPDNVTGELVSRLNGLEIDLKILVILGAAFKAHESVRRVAAASRNDVAIVTDSPDLATLVQEVDIAIAAAGTTAYELVAAGVPSAVISLAEHQKRVTEHLVQSGAAVAVPLCQSNAGFRSVVGSLISDPDVRAGLVRNAAEVFSVAGAREVVVEIFRHHAATFGRAN